ncbi:MAG TPA: NAD(P)H-dependent oxidoreductase [Caulobacterales bacterium]|nr:NAD(P)H-dependent oxidoreductase [Caulobacterales bacterium]
MSSFQRPSVAVVVGSVSKGSLNRKFAGALARLAAPKLDLKFVEIGDLPIYDYELEAALPAPVRRFKSEIEGADAVLLITPEYLRSIPAALKNALEWGARPYGKSSWAGKPAAIAGVTPGAIGTAVAQSHLRSIATVLELIVISQPELYIQIKPETFDANGDIVDPALRDLLTKFIDVFAAWVARQNHQTLLAAANF